MSRSLKAILQQSLLLALSGALTLVTAFFGAIPMRVLWATHGRLIYWLGNFVVVLGFASMRSQDAMQAAFLYLIVFVMVGVFCEFEHLGTKLFVSGFTSIITGLAAGTVAVGYWQHFTQKRWIDVVASEVQNFQTKVGSQSPQISINVDQIQSLMPSMIVVVMILGLAAALVWERGFYRRLQVKPPKRDDLSLLLFKAPNLMVWLTIFSISGAFLKHGIVPVEKISLNVFIVAVAVFFLQGAAIVTMAMHHYKVQPFWRLVWLGASLLFVPVTILVSIIGFVDFWLEFRSRMISSAAKRQA